MIVSMWKPSFLLIGILGLSQWNICNGRSLTKNQLKDDQQQIGVKFPDPEATMTLEEVVAYHGYPLQEYTVLSEDGYYTTIQRIPHGKNNTDVSNRQPVLIMHGLGGQASIWVVNIPEQNLAYILAEAGYDVWLGNSRGNAYSMHHKSLNPKQKEFWEFSWQEMAYYDMPATIDFILNKTEKAKLHYIGHSMGTTISFAMLSSRPEYNQKVFGVYAMAPVVYIEKSTDPVILLAGEEGLIDWILNTLHIYDLKFDHLFLQELVFRICGTPTEIEVCEFLLRELKFEELARLNLTRADVYLHTLPSSMSVQTVAHYGQMYNANKFQEYDFGEKKNEIIYGQPTPPQYNLSKVSAAVALFVGNGDRTADPTDVARLRPELPNVVLDFPVADPEFTHLDFMWGLSVKPLVYEPLMKLMKNLSLTET